MPQTKHPKGKNTIFVLLAVVFVLIVIAGFLLSINLHNKSYEQAQSVIEAPSEQSFAQIETSPAPTEEDLYQQALSLEREGKYNEARTAFEALGEYADSQTHVTECNYQLALLMENTGDMLDAYSAFIDLGDYKDSATHAGTVFGIMDAFYKERMRIANEELVLANALETAQTVLDRKDVYSQNEQKKSILNDLVVKYSTAKQSIALEPVTKQNFADAISTLKAVSYTNIVSEITNATRELEESTVVFADIMPETLYCSDSKFSIEAEDTVDQMPFGKTLGALKITGKIQHETTLNDVPAFVVEPSTSVSFSYDSIKRMTGTSEQIGVWKLENVNKPPKIDALNFKDKIQYGGIYVQKSKDGTSWIDAPYSRVNVFEQYQSSISNFYTASRADISNGCYYRIFFFYQATKKLDDKSFLFLDTSSYQNEWCVEEYTVYLLADEGATETPYGDRIQLFADSTINSADFGGITLANLTTANRVAGEEVFHAKQGHGFAAEAANIQIAAIRGLLRGETVIHTGSNNVANGIDYKIKKSDGTILLIQSKYCQSANNSIDDCFTNGTFRYNGMCIEVPADQFDDAILLMRSRIDKGQVPGITNPDEAKNIIRKGAVTYKQALNLAKAGTIESLTYDAVNGSVSATSAFGVSAIVQFATSMWEHKDIKIALQNSIYTGLQVGGNAFATSVLSSQLSRAGLNSLMVPGSEMVINLIGPKAAAVIVNAGRVGMKPLYGAAAMKHAAKLLRGNVIASSVSLIICTIPDAIEIFQGRISGKQMLKDLAVNAGGISGGLAGAAGGAAAGTAVLPGFGTTVGGIIGGIAGGVSASTGVDAIADRIAQDDAEEMLSIISLEFQNLIEEYLLSQEEAEEVMNQLQNKLDAAKLKDMYASDDHHAFARNLIEPTIEDIVRERKHIRLPSDKQMADALVDVLEEIYDEEDLQGAIN